MPPGEANGQVVHLKRRRPGFLSRAATPVAKLGMRRHQEAEQELQGLGNVPPRSKPFRSRSRWLKAQAMAEILPFPLARRRGFVWRQAHWYAEQPHAAAEKNLTHQLTVQRQTLEKRGIDHRRISAEVEALEHAIRAAVCRIMLQGGGAA